MRVLIVENSVIIAMHLAKFLADLGHDVWRRFCFRCDCAKSRHLNPMSLSGEVGRALQSVAQCFLAQERGSPTRSATAVQAETRRCRPK